MKETWIQKVKKVISFLINPKLLLCVGIAWMITNGWAYVLFGIGTYFSIEWMIALSGTYITLLWFPFTPEKVITAVIAIFLLRLLFPNDKKTLAILIELYQKAKEQSKKRKQAKKDSKSTQILSSHDKKANQKDRNAQE